MVYYSLIWHKNINVAVWKSIEMIPKTCFDII